MVSKRPENAQIMKEAGFVVYLKVSADAAAARIPNTESRPMFKNLDTARKTIVERAPQYEAAADVEIETENRSIREVAEEVVAVLLDRGIMIDQSKHKRRWSILNFRFLEKYLTRSYWARAFFLFSVKNLKLFLFRDHLW